MKQLVIGLGEVGTAIQSILQCDGFDFDETKCSQDEANRIMEQKYDVLHICFPYSSGNDAKSRFKSEVGDHVRKYQPSLVIVHSSVPVGTCDPQGWVHSPVRGVHPNLEQGIRTFVKYFGGKRAEEASKLFAINNIQCHVVPEARTTEAIKLWDTTQYGLMIMIQKAIYQYCEQQGLDPEMVYADANQTYAIGYEALGRPEVVRPYLKHMPGPIGGHCVIPNAHLLASPLAALLIDFNEELKNTQG